MIVAIVQPVHVVSRTSASPSSSGTKSGRCEPVHNRVLQPWAIISTSLTHSDGGTVMTNAGFPTHEGYALPCLISASVAVGAVMFAMIGILIVTSGDAVPAERAAASTAINSAKVMGRSGTLQAQRTVY